MGSETENSIALSIDILFLCPKRCLRKFLFIGPIASVKLRIWPVVLREGGRGKEGGVRRCSPYDEDQLAHSSRQAACVVS